MGKSALKKFNHNLPEADLAEYVGRGCSRTLDDARVRRVTTGLPYGCEALRVRKRKAVLCALCRQRPLGRTRPGEMTRKEITRKEMI